MDKFELVVGVIHISLIAPHMNLLEHACDRYDSTTVTGWINLQSTTWS